MIRIEIISKNRKEKELVTLYFERFFIGSGNQSQLKIKAQIPPQFLKLSIKSNGVLVETIGNSPTTINGKKILGAKLCKIQDIIQIENHSLKIIDLDPNQTNSSMDLSSLYDNFYENNEEYAQILNAIDKELLYEDYNIDIKGSES